MTTPDVITFSRRVRYPMILDGSGIGASSPVPIRPHWRCAMRGYASIGPRFWRRVSKSDRCWTWTGCGTPKGYGVVGYLGRQAYAHRVSWIIHNGPIPSGMSVCHRCDNPPCVRPEHLFLGTALDNNRDSRDKGRHHYARRDSCQKGHSLSGDNLRLSTWKGSTKRVCRACQKEAEKRYALRHLAARLTAPTGRVMALADGGEG